MGSSPSCGRGLEPSAEQSGRTCYQNGPKTGEVGRVTFLTMGLRLLLRYRLDLDMICFFEVRLRKSKCLPVFCLCWGQCV